MAYFTNDIATILSCKTIGANSYEIEHLLTDSRRVYEPGTALFFALKGPRRNGHDFIGDLYGKGVRSFVVSETVSAADYPEAVFFLVSDTLKALQDLAAYHRLQFSYPVIGITGSNGKTIVKEWLFQLLSPDYTIVRSPKSYNSQIGVPLSVWQMKHTHTLGIFEAGISTAGEMQKLAAIIKPTIGVLTNIGEAHSEGFASKEEKEKEKLLLFKEAVLPAKLTVGEIKLPVGEMKLTVIETKQPGASTIIEAKSDKPLVIRIPFTDEASIQNAISCWEVLLHLGYSNDVIAERMALLSPVDMRLTLKKAINHCLLINDSYSADISSLTLALNFLSRQAGSMKKTLVLSDLLQTGVEQELLYKQVAQLLIKEDISRLILVGPNSTAAFSALNAKQTLPFTIETFLSTEELLHQFRALSFREEAILVKGARVFAFERIAQLFQQKAHETRLEIDLSALLNNLKVYQSKLAPNVKLMAMVKAFAYGSGAVDVANLLKFHGVDYLGVAYADEGVELRKAGIAIPIMVMNPEETSFENIIEYRLEPVLFSMQGLELLSQYLTKQGIIDYPVHLELETGMNRLGFSVEQIDELSKQILSKTCFSVRSVFSHLAAAEDSKSDDFTNAQFEKYQLAVSQLQKNLDHTFIKHIANSAGAIRHKNMQLDMVRIGIGLYGIETVEQEALALKPVLSLKSTVAQIKALLPGESVSYNRKAVVNKSTLIATIRIGYADGYPRRLGNGKGHVYINGKLLPIIGTICMDMLMVDITGAPEIKEGDTVVLFGAELPVQQLANWADTIPYEILSAVSQRVKRVYFEE